ncbi:MAG: DNA-3-methyladenine glycosylase 2 family protein [Bacteroidia bacterium]|nr:DNA-3-methyladenine glycosylase 2 family protein [Bacteroidia bacterium]
MKNHFTTDPKLRSIIEQISLPEYIRPADAYLALLRAIIFQQLSGKAARTIYERFLNLFENLYPDPTQLAAADVETLRRVGLSRQKASYVKNVAEFALQHDMSMPYLQNLEDEEVIRYLCQIKGIGRWTVEMLLIFTLERADVFPLDDLGIRKAVVRLYTLDLPDKALRAKLLEIAEAWKPHRSLACKYLWKWLDSETKNAQS